MTYDQPSLLDVPVDAGTHRKADPWSSKAAARNVDITPAKDIVLAAFVANGGSGTLDTAHAAFIARGNLRIQRGTISRRIRDLVGEGRLKASDRYVDGSYDQPLAVWEVVRRG